MAKKKEAIGLDIGAQAIKIVRVAGLGADVELMDYKIREIRQGEEKVDAIKDVLKNINGAAKDVPVIVSVEGSHVFIRVFKLPGVAKSKLAKIIEYEAQQQVPFSIKEVIWSYQCLRQVSPEETDVVLAAVKTNVVNELLGAVKLDVKDIIPPVIGLNNFLSWSKYENLADISGQAVMVLDLGAKTTNVIILEKDNLWFRIIPLGAEIITQGLASEYRIDIADAEVIKRDKGSIILEGDGSPDDNVKRISTSVIKSLTRITGEISRSIEVYSSSFNSLGPKKIFITGGGSELKNIDKFFNKKFRIDTEVLNAAKNILLLDNLDKTKWGKDKPKLYTALGLAVQGLGFKKFNLSLLPKEVSKKNTWKLLQTYLTVVFGMFVFLGVCFSLYNIQLISIYKANINKISSEIKAVDINKGQLTKVQKDFDMVKYTVDKINAIKEAQNYWIYMLLELEQLLPDNVYLTGIEPSLSEAVKKRQKGFNEGAKTSLDLLLYASGTIDLKLYGNTTGAYQDIVVFRDALNNSKYFVKDASKVLSANPPHEGLREFTIETKGQVAGEYE